MQKKIIIIKKITLFLLKVYGNQKTTTVISMPDFDF